MTDDTEYTELALHDGTSVRLEVARVPRAGGGVGGVSPVGRGASGAAARATQAARAVLRPLGPLLQEVHDAVSTTPDPPQEITVQFGVQVGQDLKLGIVGANGHASLTISATWRTADAGGTGGAGGGTGDGSGAAGGGGGAVGGGAAGGSGTA